MRVTLTLLALFCAPALSAQEIQRINPEGMTQPSTYSHLVRTGDGPDKGFILTGPEPVGFAEVAAAIGAAIGKDVAYVPVPHEAAKESMVGMGIPE